MISIIVSWRNRTELSKALPSLIKSAESVDGDITIVNYGGSGQLLQQQIKPFTEHVSIVEVSDLPYFNKSAAQNLGAAHTANPFLFFTDCDIIFQEDTLRLLVAGIVEKDRTFATLAKVTESEKNSRGGNHVTCFGYHLYIRTADNRQLHIIDNEEDADDGSRQAPGLLLVRRTDFEMLKGYNSRLHGWGWEDQDMIARLTLGLGLERISDFTAVHISHDDVARTDYYPISNRWESRDKMFRQALANYDNADFLGTLDEDRKSAAYQISGTAYCAPSAAA